MTFEQAKQIAAKLGAKVPTYPASAPVTQCWIDRIEWLQHQWEWAWNMGQVPALATEIREANRYAGA